MPIYFRYGLLTAGVLSLILTIGFFWQLPWATALWPWPDSRLSYIFLASILASVAASILWAALSEEYGALVGGAINLAFSNVVMAATGFSVYASTGSTGALMMGIVGLLLMGVSVVLYMLTRRYQIRDPRPMPRVVKVSFAIFVAALILVGTALLLGVQVFPWPLNPYSATIFAGIFLGAACFFGYSLLRPSWHNARGQLWGFLAYDLVLIVPFLSHFGKVAPDRMLNLIIYVAVLAYSSAVAIYFLFIDPATRPARVSEVVPPQPSSMEIRV